MKVKISDIKVRKRIRKDNGDLGELVNSMQKNGLLNPVTINEKRELIAGYRRLQSAKLLGWDEIECSVVSAKSRIDKFNIEVDENITRKDFTFEELQGVDEMRRYLASKGIKKVFLWFKMLVGNFLAWIRGLFTRKG